MDNGITDKDIWEYRKIYGNKISKDALIKIIEMEKNGMGWMIWGGK